MINLKNTNETILFSLPFGGFYNSIHSEQVNIYIDSMGYDWEQVNFKATYLNYSKDLLNYIESELSTPLNFISLDSPRYYNYRTDKIECEISQSNYISFITEHLDNDAKVWITENCKSVDGFVSFYPTLDKVSSEPQILLEYLFEYLFNELEEPNLLYFDFCGKIVINELNPTKNV